MRRIIRDASTIGAFLAGGAFDRRCDASGNRVAGINRAEVAVVAVARIGSAAYLRFAKIDSAGVAILTVDIAGTEIILAVTVDTGRSVRATLAIPGTWPRAIGTDAAPSLGAVVFAALPATTLAVFVTDALILDTECICIVDLKTENNQRSSCCAPK